MSKRGLALLLALTLLLGLTACGSSEETDETQDEPAVEEPAEEPASAETDDTAVIDEVQETEPELGQGTAEDAVQPETGSRPADSTQKPTGTMLPAASQTADQTATVPSAGAQTPAAAETPAESQSKPAPSVDLSAFYESLVTTGEWPAMMAVEGEVLDSFYPGLSDIAANQCIVSTAMISAAVGEVALVEVQNASDVQKVKSIFQARIDYQVGDDENPGAAWYPETIEGWQKNARIVSNGSYVMLVAYENADAAVKAFNALFA